MVEIFLYLTLVCTQHLELIKNKQAGKRKHDLCCEGSRMTSARSDIFLLGAALFIQLFACPFHASYFNKSAISPYRQPLKYSTDIQGAPDVMKAPGQVLKRAQNKKHSLCFDGIQRLVWEQILNKSFPRDLIPVR